MATTKGKIVVTKKLPKRGGGDDSFQCAKYQGGYSPDESNLKYYEEDNYREKNNIWMSSIRHINLITTRSIVINGSKQALFFSVNTSTKSKRGTMTDVCSKNSVSVFVNGSVEVSHTGSKFILIVFDNDLSDKSIYIYMMILILTYQMVLLLLR